MVSQQSSCRVIEKLVSIQLLTKMSVPVIGLVLIEVRRCIDWKKLLVQLILNKLFTLLFYGVFFGGGGVERFLLYTFVYEGQNRNDLKCLGVNWKALMWII